MIYLILDSGGYVGKEVRAGRVLMDYMVQGGTMDEKVWRSREHSDITFWKC